MVSHVFFTCIFLPFHEAERRLNQIADGSFFGRRQVAKRLKQLVKKCTALDGRRGLTSGT